MVASPWFDPWICVIFLNSCRALKGNTEKTYFFHLGVWICVFSPLDPVDLLGDYFSSYFNCSRVLGFQTMDLLLFLRFGWRLWRKEGGGVGEGTPDLKVRSGGGWSCLFNRTCRCRCVGRSVNSRAHRFQPAAFCFGKGQVQHVF
jgi:hypothetical protein